MNGFESLYAKIGHKIKSLATWIFVGGSVLSVIVGILIIAMSYGSLLVILCGIGYMFAGPILSWMSTWALYGLGVLIEKISLIEHHTRYLASRQTIDSNK